MNRSVVCMSMLWTMVLLGIGPVSLASNPNVWENLNHYLRRQSSVRLMAVDCFSHGSDRHSYLYALPPLHRQPGYSIADIPTPGATRDTTTPTSIDAQHSSSLLSSASGGKAIDAITPAAVHAHPIPSLGSRLRSIPIEICIPS